MDENFNFTDQEKKAIEDMKELTYAFGWSSNELKELFNLKTN